MTDLRLRVLFDHELVTELQLSTPLSIGRAADNDLVLSDEAVSSYHGRVERDATGWSFADAGSANGSLVAAGPRLGQGERVPLDELVQIMVGRTVLEFEPRAGATAKEHATAPPRNTQSSEAAASTSRGAQSSEATATTARDARGPTATASELATPSPEPPAARVVVVEKQERRLVRLVPPRVLIGRAEDCALRVSCPSVSQHHAELRADADGWLLRDLGSTNGTRVGLVPLKGEKRLASGSHLILGQLDLFFVLDGAAEPEGEQRAFLRWLAEERELNDAQVEQARAAQRSEACSLDEALVHSGLLAPGRLTELRRQAAGDEELSEDERAELADRNSSRRLLVVAVLLVFALLAWLARDA